MPTEKAGKPGDKAAASLKLHCTLAPLPQHGITDVSVEGSPDMKTIKIVSF